MLRKILFTIVLIASLGGVASYLIWPKAPVWAKIRESAVAKAITATVKKRLGGGAEQRPAEAADASFGAPSQWNGTVELTDDQVRGIGLAVAPVIKQADPISLEILGTTAYDPDTLTKIRPKFKSLVQKVFKKNGQSVEIGDPLVELFSAELADAENDYLSKYAQWRHDKALLEKIAKLAFDEAVAVQKKLDAENDELKSRLDYEVALKKLHVYQLDDDDIEKIRNEHQRGDETAKMILRSPVAGKIITREVAPGNLYDDQSPPLMVIAPLDHLWVWANVFESDISKAKLGQTMIVDFPFLKRSYESRVEFIANEVNPDTHAVRVRASIANDGELKSEMMVKARIQIPPGEGQTVVPRVSMITSPDEKQFVFVRTSPGANQFARREVVPILERDQYVILGPGSLTPGQEVATTGALILEQRFEDLFATKFGAPLTASSPEQSGNPIDSEKPRRIGRAGGRQGFDFEKAPL